MDILHKIDEMAKKRGWSQNRLAREAGLSQSTLSGLYRRNNVPTIPTLEKICGAFGMTLGQFFGEGAGVTDEQRRLLELWGTLSEKNRTAVWALLERL